MDESHPVLCKALRNMRDAHAGEIELPAFCDWILGYLAGFDAGVSSIGIIEAVPKPPPEE